jgi:hypothetical protein
MQLPRQITAPEFGEVNVSTEGGKTKVRLTILMKPDGDDAMGWQTGLALDASQSMRGRYGRSAQGQLPPAVEAQYEKRGWVEHKHRDGGPVKTYRKEALQDAFQKGYLRYTENIMEPKARDLIAYLAREVDADGGTTVIYWAGGDDGSDIEVLGDVTEAEVATLEVRGPKQVPFGDGTVLTPAVQYFVKRFKDAKYGMYVFLTDGALDDLDEVKAYTTRLARDIESGKRNPVKCILIGIGDQVKEAQMEELDDLDTGTDVDIWDHKIAEEMTDLVQLFSEPIKKNMKVAASARVYDSRGGVVANFPRGLNAEVEFTMAMGHTWFELEVPGLPQRIRQTVVPPRK